MVMTVSHDNQNPTCYRVLARKYRPTNFGQLVGQNGMVRTLENAMASGRIAHAFMLTGVRGTGKTTTARIIAKALNCLEAHKDKQNVANPCGVCDSCVAIAEDRHIDVLEMDAASRTGVDDIRELIEGVQYKPSVARFKVYIIDEVHMLSKNAFNALLKTLEEPPEHVKFIFATTEIRKVPVTVLSRCQRFDLKRITEEVLISHLQKISEKEGINADRASLRLIANAADGSVRDGLSLLDQAISLSEQTITEGIVQSMLGLADRTAIYNLFEALMKGEIQKALNHFSSMHNNGSEPLMVLQDLLDLTYWLTRIKIDPNIGKADHVAETEKIRGSDLANKMNMPTLTRTWQLILRGLKEISNAPSSRKAAEMVLVRLAYAADLPPANTLMEKIKNNQSSLLADSSTKNPSSGDGTNSAGPNSGQLETAPNLNKDIDIETVVTPRTFKEVVSMFSARKEAAISSSLRRNVHLVHFEPGRIEIRPDEHVPRNFASRVAALLSDWTETRWIVSISTDLGNPTLEEQYRRAEKQKKDVIEKLPAVQAIKKAFPGSAISKVTPKSGLTPTEDDAILQHKYNIEEER